MANAVPPDQHQKKDHAHLHSVSYTKIARSAASLLMLGSLIVKFLSLISNIILGWVLSDSDFGVYGIAIAASAFILAFQNGGVQQLLVRQGSDSYEEMIGPCFWISVSINLALASTLFFLTPKIVSAYGEPGVGPLLYVIIFTLFFSPIRAVLFARLLIDLRYSWQAGMAVCSALIQYVGTVAMALMGFGPLSFVVPLLVVAIIECLVLLVLFWRQLRVYDLNFRMWPRILADVKWLLAAAFVGALSLQGDKFIGGLIIDTSQLGIYVFAVSFVVNAQRIVTSNLQQLLLPILSKIKSDVSRQISAVERVINSTLIISTPLLCALALSFPYLESFLYAGSWSEAVPVVQMLALIFPLRALVSIMNVWQVATGNYLNQLLTLIAHSAISIAGAGAGAWIGKSATAMAIGVSLGNFFVCQFIVILMMKKKGLRWNHIVQDFASYYVALGVFGVLWLMTMQLQIFKLLDCHGFLAFADSLLLFFLYGTTYVVLMRFLMAKQFRDALRILPRHVEVIMVRVLNYID